LGWLTKTGGLGLLRLLLAVSSRLGLLLEASLLGIKGLLLLEPCLLVLHGCGLGNRLAHRLLILFN
jgi:hypothetical protein